MNIYNKINCPSVSSNANMRYQVKWYSYEMYGQYAIQNFFSGLNRHVCGAAAASLPVQYIILKTCIICNNYILCYFRTSTRGLSSITYPLLLGPGKNIKPFVSGLYIRESRQTCITILYKMYAIMVQSLEINIISAGLNLLLLYLLVDK